MDQHLLSVPNVDVISTSLTVGNSTVTHIKSKNIKLNEKNSKLDHIFSCAKEDFSVIRAECYFTAFLIEHNLPLSAADHAGIRKMFPGATEAKKIWFRQNKNHKYYEIDGKGGTNVIKLQNQPFAIATDGSNGTDKMYPLVVTFFNEETCRVENALLCAPSLSGDSTGKNIANLIVQSLTSRNLPLENCIGFECDNANVMVGKKNGVAAIFYLKPILT